MGASSTSNSRPEAALPGFVLEGAESGETSCSHLIMEALHAIRAHLSMDVAFVSEFKEGNRVFRYVDAEAGKEVVLPGTCSPLEGSYCQRIVDGRFPELIRDVSQVPEALALPVTQALSIGAYLGVPIRLSSGALYGTFCCFSMKPDPSLTDRDLAMMRVFADFTAKQIERTLAERNVKEATAARIRAVLDGEEFSIVYQPIFHCLEGRIVGFEALTRFAALPKQGPDRWFREAAEVGLGVELETKVVGEALKGLGLLPKDVYMSLNVSPETVMDGAVETFLENMPLDRVIIEVTEHDSIPEYSGFTRMLKCLRDKGLRLAVDDAGAGYASFRHILELAPDMIKLDISLTQRIDTDRNRRALAAALIRFAEETGIRIVAEGVETESELAVLRDLGVNKVQGFLLGRPMPIQQASAMCMPPS